MWSSTADGLRFSIWEEVTSWTLPDYRRRVHSQVRLFSCDDQERYDDASKLQSLCDLLSQRNQPLGLAFLMMPIVWKQFVFSWNTLSTTDCRTQFVAF